jgi:hypothetical protein
MGAMPKPESTGKIVEKIYDLTFDGDLSELERIKSRPDRYRILKDEQVTVPMCHIQYELLDTIHPRICPCPDKECPLEKKV